MTSPPSTCPDEATQLVPSLITSISLNLATRRFAPGVLKCGGMEASEARRLKAVEDENRKRSLRMQALPLVGGIIRLKLTC
jgi:hypothetical protein